MYRTDNQKAKKLKLHSKKFKLFVNDFFPGRLLLSASRTTLMYDVNKMIRSRSVL